MGLEEAGAATVRSPISGALCGCVSFRRQARSGAAEFAALLVAPRSRSASAHVCAAIPCTARKKGTMTLGALCSDSAAAPGAERVQQNEEDFIALLAQQNRSTERGARSRSQALRHPPMSIGTQCEVCAAETSQEPRSATAAELCLAVGAVPGGDAGMQGQVRNVCQVCRRVQIFPTPFCEPPGSPTMNSSHRLLHFCCLHSFFCFACWLSPAPDYSPAVTHAQQGWSFPLAASHAPCWRTALNPLSLLSADAPYGI